MIGLDLREPEENVAEFIPVNLAETASIQSAVKHIGDGIDGLCNIAGVPPTKGVALVLQVNFPGTRALKEALIPTMRPGASIVLAPA
ncbi:MAG: hypothetical protein ACM3WS_02325 [Bacillota bacterium]